MSYQILSSYVLLEDFGASESYAVIHTLSYY